MPRKTSSNRNNIWSGIFGCIIGMIIGSMATWFKQGKHRKRARVNANEAIKWHTEADREKAKAKQIAAALPPQDKRSAA